MKNLNDMVGRQLVVNGFQVATVMFVGEGFGNAKYFRDLVRFDGETGYKIVMGNSQFPEFGDEYAPAPEEGDAIVVIVTRTPKGWIAAGWGLYTEYKKVQAEIEARMQKLPTPAWKPQSPKAAPTLPVPVNGILHSTPRASASKDRRPVRPIHQNGEVVLFQNGSNGHPSTSDDSFQDDLSEAAVEMANAEDAKQLAKVAG